MRRLILRKAVTTDCDWPITENSQFTHAGHAPNHSPKNGKTKWTGENHPTAHGITRDRIFQLLLLWIFVVIYFLGKVDIAFSTKVFACQELLCKDIGALAPSRRIHSRVPAMALNLLTCPQLSTWKRILTTGHSFSLYLGTPVNCWLK